MNYSPHEYQQTACDFILSHEKAGLMLDMGLGKTVITLTAVNELMFNRFEISRVLVIAPKRVAEDTWSRESEKWDHTKHFRISKVLGNATERLAALRADADIYVINRENVKWLTDSGVWKFDMVVIDELSSFKSNSSQRFKALRKMMPLVKRVVGLTGTPTPNGLIDLWPQIYLLDRGERLGKTLTGYRERYFYPGGRNGYVVYSWTPKPEAEQAIQKKISDICISMSAKDYLTLPERMDNVVEVRLSDGEMKKYRDFEQDQLMELDDMEVVALTAAAVSGKLLQMANGAVYDSGQNVIEVHKRKLEALEDILEFNQEPVLVFYNFKHDYDRIMTYFADYKPRKLDNSNDISDWNHGRIRLLLAHPASVGHGLNIQAGGNVIVWFGLTWSLELYQQANARLYRQGQTKNVIIHHLVAQGTVDEDVMRALKRKDAGQAALLEAIKARKRRYYGTVEERGKA